MWMRFQIRRIYHYSFLFERQGRGGDGTDELNMYDFNLRPRE